VTHYRVTHRTTYRYEEPVSASYGQMHLLPRTADGQTCHTTRMAIDPTPDDLRERIDYFGNRAAFYAIHSEHTSLTVTTTSDLAVNRGGLGLLDAPSWEEVRDRTASPAVDDGWEPIDFLLDSPLVAASPGLADYAGPSFAPGRPVLEALLDLAQRIHDDFDYEPGSTSVTTTVDDVLAARQGVCQDFAHLAIGCLRSLGLAARYVSGYLETTPPPGKEHLQGADVSHAWAALWIPGSGWVDVDPTNEHFVDDRYVTTAWGRDYADVPPLKGVIFTKGLEHDLDVVVDVVRLDDPG
jgi:transglutaminase-like putative cysteine protease